MTLLFLDPKRAQLQVSKLVEQEVEASRSRFSRNEIEETKPASKKEVSKLCAMVILDCPHPLTTYYGRAVRSLIVGIAHGTDLRSSLAPGLLLQSVPNT